MIWSRLLSVYVDSCLDQGCLCKKTASQVTMAPAVSTLNSDQWQERVARLLQRIRDCDASTVENSVALDRVGKDAAAGYIHTNNLVFEMDEIHAYYETNVDNSGRPVRHRSIFTACYALVCALTADRALSRLDESFRNATSWRDKACALRLYITDAFMACGLGWLSSTAMVAVDKLLETFVCTEDWQHLLVSEAKTCGVALIVRFVVEVLVYCFRACNGRSSPEQAPWKPANLLGSAIMAAAIGLTNELCCSIGLSGILPVLLSFVVVSVVDDLLKQFQEESLHLGLWQALKRMLPFSDTASLEWKDDEVPEDMPRNMRCQISGKPFVEPVVCHGDVFEKKYLEEFVVNRGKHPFHCDQRISLLSIRPCPEMKILVEEYARQHKMTKM